MLRLSGLSDEAISKLTSEAAITAIIDLIRARVPSENRVGCLRLIGLLKSEQVDCAKDGVDCKRQWRVERDPPGCGQHGPSERAAACAGTGEQISQCVHMPSLRTASEGRRSRIDSAC